MHKFDGSKARIEDGKKGYIAICECGWSSNELPTKEEAIISFENHVKSDPHHKAWKEEEGANIPSLLLGALGFLYIISPVDLVPDYLVGVGWMEDILIGILCFILIKGGLNSKSPVETLSDIFS